jgi:hypothetical protein
MAERIAAGPATAFDVHVTGRRVLAIIADGLLLGVLFSAVSVLARMAGLGEADAPLFAGYTWAGGFFVLAMAYYALMEGYRGQTVGKMLFGIRVVREDGGGMPGFKGPRKVAAAHRGRPLRLPGGLRGGFGLGEEPAPRRHGGPHPGDPRVAPLAPFGAPLLQPGSSGSPALSGWERHPGPFLSLALHQKNP